MAKKKHSIYVLEITHNSYRTKTLTRHRLASLRATSMAASVILRHTPHRLRTTERAHVADPSLFRRSPAPRLHQSAAAERMRHISALCIAYLNRNQRRCAARALVTRLKLAIEEPPGRVGLLPKMKTSHFSSTLLSRGPSRA